MDESRTIRELEELADLFLTEAFEQARPGGASTSESHDGSAAQDAAAGRISDANPAAPTDAADRGEESAPPTRTDAAMQAPEPDRPSNLRLSQSDSDQEAYGQPPSGFDAAADVAVEAVFLGNLPGYAHPWLTQYAHHVARSAGPVAVLHLDDEQVDLEMVGEVDDITLGRVSVAGDLAATLTALVDNRVTPVRHFLIHVAMAAGPDAANLVRGIERWTLLSGADNTAVIAAYQLLKQMLDGRGRAAEPPPSVGVMVLGSDEGPSLDAARKIETTASNFLKLDLRLLGHRKQMLPVQVRYLGSFVFGDGEETGDASDGGDWGRSLQLLTDLQHAGEGEGTSSADTMQRPEVQTRALPTASLAGRPPLSEAERMALSGDTRADADADAARHDAQRDSGARSMEVHQPAGNDSERRSFAQPAQAVAREAASQQPSSEQVEPDAPSPDQDDDEPDLALFVRQSGEAPGAVGLEARCPRQQAVRVLLDQRGRLHLLARQSADEPAAAALSRLMHAAAWAREHVDLLRLTQRQMHFDRDRVPLLHLFTGHAKQAVGLTQQASADLKIHLLQSVRTGQGATWVCNALN